MSTEPEGWYIDAGPPAKPRRSRANLRPRSRSASVIDRLLKNQNPLENCNNLRLSSPHLVVGKRPGTAPQFCGPKFIDAGAMAVPIASVRFGHSTTRRRGARRPPPREDPAQARHALAGGFDNRTIGSSKRSRCSLQPGMTPVPHHAFLHRKIAARLFRRCPAAG